MEHFDLTFPPTTVIPASDARWFPPVCGFRSIVAAKDVGLNITSVDNEVSVTLNGALIGFIVRTPFGNYPQVMGPTKLPLVIGQNVLCISLVNYEGSGNNPASINGTITIDGVYYSLEWKSPVDNARQGLMHQVVILVDKQ